LNNLHRRVFPGILFAAFSCESIFDKIKEVPLKPSVSLNGDMMSLGWSLINRDNADSFLIYSYINDTTITDIENDTLLYEDYRFALSTTSSVAYSVPNCFRAISKDTSVSAISLLNRYEVRDISDSFKCYLRYDLESNYDFALFEASTDGFKYAPLDTLKGLFTGNNGGWKYFAAPLSGYLGKEVTIRLRVTYDDNTLDTGVRIDNIYPVVKFESASVHAAGVTDTLYPLISADYMKKFTVKSKNNIIGYTQLSDRFMNTSTLKNERTVLNNNLDLSETPYISNNVLNGFISIKFADKISRKVKYKIIDIAGRTLVNDMQSGNSVVRIGVSMLKSGVYFLNLPDYSNYNIKITIIN